MAVYLVSAIAATAGPAKGAPKVMVASKPVTAPVSSSVASGSVGVSGGEYAIAGALPGDQTFPQAALSSSGGYLVWVDNSVTTNGLRIRAGKLDGNFNLSGAPFVVSSAAASKATGDQEHPQVALLKNGGVVFVWQGGVQGSQQIYIRYLSSAGKWLAADARVSAQNSYNQARPQLTVLNDGTVLVVWQSYGQDGSMFGVFARHFSATGAALTAEFLVNQATLYNQRSPSVATLANGNFVVAWVSELERAAASVDVYARIFTSAGKAVTSEFPVDLTTSNSCANPSVAASPNGGFAIAWSQNSNVGSTRGSQGGATVAPTSTALSTNGWDVYARIFNSAGAPTTNPFRLNTYTYGDQYAPTLAASGTDYFGVWTSMGQDGSWEGVYGQLLSNAGVAEGAEMQINTTTFNRQIQPSIATDGNGRYLVVWTSYVLGAVNYDLFAQAFQSSGQ